MKNKIKLISLVALFLSVGIFINKADAVNISNSEKKAIRDDKKIAREEIQSEKICGRIENVITRLEKNLGDDGLKLRERNENRTREMEQNQVSTEAELENRRKVRDESREEFYNKIEESATDDAVKKEAVEKFKIAVEEAIKIRREAIDSARENMNTAIVQAIKNRETSMESLRKEFEANVASAGNKAKSSCDDNSTNEDLKNVLTQLRNDIKLAKDEYKSKSNEAKKVQETVRKLRDDRKVAVKLAIENFKTAMKKAQEELRMAIGE